MNLDVRFVYKNIILYLGAETICQQCEWVDFVHVCS